jgi:hypothetical protein
VKIEERALASWIRRRMPGRVNPTILAERTDLASDSSTNVIDYESKPRRDVSLLLPNGVGELPGVSKRMVPSGDPVLL